MQDRLPWAPIEKRPFLGSGGADHFTVLEKGPFLEIETSTHRLRLNCRRGLSIDGWWDKSRPGQPLIRTLPHGYFDDIQYSADFYTGHFVLEVPGRHKITDLCSVSPGWKIENGCVTVRADIQTIFGAISKELRIDSEQNGFDISYQFHWPVIPHGALRLGHITLNPEAFEEKSLFFRSHNGGDTPESFNLCRKPVNHLAPVSSLVSISNGLGVTSGVVEVGDRHKRLSLKIDKCDAALTGHIVYTPVGNQYFYRVVFSAMEMDDTSCQTESRTCFRDRIVKISVSRL
jgi:hypothetical protein